MTIRTLDRLPGDAAGRGESWRFEMVAAVALQVFVLLAIRGLVGLSVAGWLAAGAYLALLCVGVAAGWSRFLRLVAAIHEPSLGPANLITLARSLLIGGVVALVVTGLPAGWTDAQRALTVALAAVAVVLDGVDGQVARRTRTSSAFGARFDIEIDSVLALVVAGWLAWTLTPLALVIGFARYLYLGAARVWPWLTLPLPTRLSRKVIGLSGSVALIFAMARLVPDPVGIGVVAVATAAVVWSFGRDILAQRRLSRSSSVRARTLGS
jgi:phosphatidylglycerophosphate synthase